MSGVTIFKLILVGIMSVCASISVFSGMFTSRKYKKQNKRQETQDRNVVKIRLTCFLIMLVCLFLCVVIK